mmetsp:Transcript_5903/g.9029  ORF Transcript_5903/g.9029 Transcript_5903/m.9029 type:complete len:191 (+) Transcript_5903:113-685(+)|eukprot:CAMPEP_0118675456 /NCGR_PEP_ID=MMETSP0800-20121206/1461_1 /TAXON_ID=210618 ORGANISM="Striatella unipunctata, Strain CCMP2910" /NCGR_SAMPLE_ID=MMETSP0800 /ASSEMBLY_ACC=CAM_ASM_000638 /LENGTH=190 /DNA_ID=CAMNT_0006570779 /DNA_START=74 /DNA_END=646 /DNA_ORIENTATION=+
MSSRCIISSTAANAIIHRVNAKKATEVLVRYRHSERQVRRVFRQNPARLRVESRMGIEHLYEPLQDPKYPAIFAPDVLKNGWSAPPPPELEIPEYPFKVTRTKNKPNRSIGFLPVYSTFRLGGSRVTTRIKGISGDQDAFVAELRAILKTPPPVKQNPRDDPIRIRAGGTVEVDGNHVREVTEWLAGLGF